MQYVTLRVSGQFLVYKECSCSREILSLVSSGSFCVLLRVGFLFSHTNSSSVSFCSSSLGLSFPSLFFLISKIDSLCFFSQTIFWLFLSFHCCLESVPLFSPSFTILVRSSFNCMSLNLCVLVASILGDFSFSFDLSRGLANNHLSRSFKRILKFIIPFSMCLEEFLLRMDCSVHNPGISLCPLFQRLVFPF